MKNKAEEYHSEIIESLIPKEPNIDDYTFDGDTMQYIKDLQEYVKYLKSVNETESEMFEMAQDADRETIKKLKNYIRSIRDTLIVDGHNVEYLNELLIIE